MAVQLMAGCDGSVRARRGKGQAVSTLQYTRTTSATKASWQRRTRMRVPDC
ncbi:hypothetical protein [Krasilnikovia cinnamomea]|nr:hypothetical protein [Krasilnikovia cinnamomea]